MALCPSCGCDLDYMQCFCKEEIPVETDPKRNTGRTWRMMIRAVNESLMSGDVLVIVSSIAMVEELERYASVIAGPLKKRLKMTYATPSIDIGGARGRFKMIFVDHSVQVNRAWVRMAERYAHKVYIHNDDDGL